METFLQGIYFNMTVHSQKKFPIHIRKKYYKSQEDKVALEGTTWWYALSASDVTMKFLVTTKVAKLLLSMFAEKNPMLTGVMHDYLVHLGITNKS